MNVGQFNSRLDQIERALEEGGGGLPEVTAEDNGDVLAVVDGEWAKAEAPSGLPEVSSADNGDVLTVVSGVWAKAEAPSGLPEYALDDEGKYLSVTVPIVTLMNVRVDFSEHIGYLSDSSPLDSINAGDQLKVTIKNTTFTNTVTVSQGDYEVVSPTNSSVGLLWRRGDSTSGQAYYTADGTNFVVKVQRYVPTPDWVTPPEVPSELPPYGITDEGRKLTVVERKKLSTMIVPIQKAELGGYSMVQLQNVSGFSAITAETTNAYIEFDGVRKNATVDATSIYGKTVSADFKSSDDSVWYSVSIFDNNNTGVIVLAIFDNINNAYITTGSFVVGLGLAGNSDEIALTWE